ncbi:MAG: UDP-N-acetylmuramate--L-alanine ligase [Fibrobacterota bacterium]
MVKRVKQVHFVGIGGCGMSGIAEILLASGYRVTGSDMAQTAVTQRLQRLGIRVLRGHAAGNITGADAVVYSSAVPAGNPELLAAAEKGVPVIRRAEMLGELMRMKCSVGVAGTHGKTTTTSMLGGVLTEGKLDPTVIVGGIVRQSGTGAVKGRGRYLVAEADEFDRSFLKMPSTIAVITTLEAEHLDCYTDLDDIKSAFVTFAEQVPFYGAVILCIDEPSVLDLLPRLKQKVVLTYGFSADADYRVTKHCVTEHGSRFSVAYRGRLLGEVELRVPGEHNIKNAMAAVAVGRELGVPFPAIARALRKFEGVRRRFEIKGEKKGIMVVDDYAHHPTEVQATLKAARETYQRRILAVFQPHLYTRTRDFSADFGTAFTGADALIVTDVYASREKPIPGVTGRLVADAARGHGHRHVRFIREPEAIVRYVKAHARKGDMVITLGAGDIWKTGEKILKAL